MRRWGCCGLLACGVLACGRIGFDATSGSNSQRTDAGPDAAPDVTAPRIVLDNFSEGAALPGTATFFGAEVRFSEPVTGVSDATILVDEGALIVELVTSDGGTSWTFAVGNLMLHSRYTIQFTGEIRDRAGNPLVPVTRAIRKGVTWYVVDGGKGSQTGLSPGNALPTITSALAAVTATGMPGEVSVGHGIFDETLTLGQVALRGGFATDFRTRDPEAMRTIIRSTQPVTITVTAASGEQLVSGMWIENYGTPSSIGVDCNGCGIWLNTSSVAAGLDASATTAFGVQANGANFSVTNSTVYSTRIGVSLTGTASPIFSNNTIGGGSSAFTMGGGATPILANNVLFAISTLLDVIRELDSGSDPRSLENNMVIGPAGLYLDEGTTSLTTTTSMDQLAGTAVGSTGETCRAASNLTSAAIGTLLVAVDGVDGVPATMLDNDWRLQSGSPADTAGKNTSTETCGTLETAQTCGNVTTDKTYSTRIAPYSIGAYEQ